MQQEPSLVRLSELETTGLDSHISQGIDRSEGTKNNLARQDVDSNMCITQAVDCIILLLMYIDCYFS